jgi:ribulose-5-phosphate 4-epimerase/fuculose-1-phosphate aldolase
MLMRGHGCNVVGDSVPSMVQAVITLRDNVVIQLAALQLGQPRYVTYEEARKSAGTIRGTERAWNYYVARAKKAKPDLR